MSKTFRLVTYHDVSKKAEILQLGDDEYPKDWSSITRGYPTIEELYEKAPLAFKPCSVCGSPYALQYDKSHNARLLHHRMCFTCDFWREKVADYTKNDVVVAGHFYRLLNADPAAGRMLGHGGSKFFCRRLGETEIKEFNNVWHCGEVPPQYRDRLVDTAEFVDPPFRMQYSAGKIPQWLNGRGFLSAQEAWNSIKGNKEGFRVIDSEGNEHPALQSSGVVQISRDYNPCAGMMPADER